MNGISFIVFPKCLRSFFPGLLHKFCIGLLKIKPLSLLYRFLRFPVPYGNRPVVQRKIDQFINLYAFSVKIILQIYPAGFSYLSRTRIFFQPFFSCPARSRSDPPVVLACSDSISYISYRFRMGMDRFCPPLSLYFFCCSLHLPFG